jgi:hypothetical protein
MKKIDKKTKETYSKDEMKRYLGALHEDYKGKLDVVVEGINIIKKKQDQHTEILGRHEKILNMHTEMLGRHEKILNMHTEMIGNIMEDVSVLKDDMQIVKKELKKKVDYDEFLSLVQRVNKLEAKN